MTHPHSDDRTDSTPESTAQQMGEGASFPPNAQPGVLLLMSPATYRAGAFLCAAERLGIHAFQAVDHHPDLPELPESILGLDLNHADHAIEQVIAFTKRHPVDAVLSVDDSATLVAARANASLGLPHNDPGISARCSRQMGDAAGVRPRRGAGAVVSAISGHVRSRRYRPVRSRSLASSSHCGCPAAGE